ncbi:hypothetical protein L249_2639, partial [Ophiocordyceps polyrhachis-furcata BCC 54312]
MAKRRRGRARGVPICRHPSRERGGGDNRGGLRRICPDFNVSARIEDQYYHYQGDDDPLLSSPVLSSPLLSSALLYDEHLSSSKITSTLTPITIQPLF